MSLPRWINSLVGCGLRGASLGKTDPLSMAEGKDKKDFGTIMTLNKPWITCLGDDKFASLLFKPIESRRFVICEQSIL